jgi:hypothetical protein
MPKRRPLLFEQPGRLPEELQRGRFVQTKPDWFCRDETLIPGFIIRFLDFNRLAAFGRVVKGEMSQEHLGLRWPGELIPPRSKFFEQSVTIGLTQDRSRILARRFPPHEAPTVIDCSKTLESRIVEDRMQLMDRREVYQMRAANAGIDGNVRRPKIPLQASTPCTTSPAMSVRRKSRPAWRYVRRVCSSPSRCRMVAWKSWTWTLLSVALMPCSSVAP